MVHKVVCGHFYSGLLRFGLVWIGRTLTGGNGDNRGFPFFSFWTFNLNKMVWNGFKPLLTLIDLKQALNKAEIACGIKVISGSGRLNSRLIKGESGPAFNRKERPEERTDPNRRSFT